MALHLALLGDSVFDNRAYTKGELDVASHLRALLGDAGKVTLVALDGTTTTDIGKQLRRCPRDASHIVLSVGGNDARANAGLLDTPVTSTGAALDLFAAALAEFDADYCNVLDALAGRTLIVCTIYGGNLGPPEATRAKTALMLFNDVIVRAAGARGVDVIELRSVCTTPADFANPIEPSALGGAKIARSIAAVIGHAKSTKTVLHVMKDEP